MNWDSVQQVVRIVLYSAGAYVLGDGVANGESFQALIGGVLNIGAFVWWYVWERKRD
ncbi:MAG: hypothetical protein Q8M26_08655 [Pseudolabrys sp.]|nr:hypothetical protein [Pseudolabrys sp.]